MTESTITIDFAVPTHYTTGPRFAAWQTAVDEARKTIERIEYKGQVINKDAPDYEPRRMVQEDDTLVHYTRAFVHMRAVTRSANGSTDGVLMTWEVFRDSVVKMEAN